MNLNLALKLLRTTDEQPYGFLKMRGRESVHEVQRLVEAGLVETSSANTEDSSTAVIKCATDAGHTFLRAFKGESAADVIRTYAHPI